MAFLEKLDRPDLSIVVRRFPHFPIAAIAETRDKKPSAKGSSGSQIGCFRHGVYPRNILQIPYGHRYSRQQLWNWKKGNRVVPEHVELILAGERKARKSVNHEAAL
jgi:hypothetical protein